MSDAPELSLPVSAKSVSAMPTLIIVADDSMPAIDACCQALLSANVEIQRYPGRELTAAQVRAADVLLVRSITPVNAALLAGSRVRFVGTATIGTDHLDCAWLDAQGIAWAAAPGCNARAVGEWVLNVLVQLAVEQKVSLVGRQLGIVGFGHVGRWVARLARCLGIQVMACDPLLTTADLPPDLADVPLLDLSTLLARADIVSVHTPLTRSGPEATWHLLDSAALAYLRPGAWLINAGRGEVIAAAHLQPFLAQLTVVLDVWDGEPEVPTALLAGVRWGSPHIAGHSLEGKWRGSWHIVAALADFLAITALPLEPSAAETPSLSTILPSTGVLSLPCPDSGLSLEVRLATLFAAIIPLIADDQRLRAAQCHTLPAQAFDALRKHYPVRREFPAHQVLIAEQDALYPIVLALGFTPIATGA